MLKNSRSVIDEKCFVPCRVTWKWAKLYGKPVSAWRVNSNLGLGLTHTSKLTSGSGDNRERGARENLAEKSLARERELFSHKKSNKQNGSLVMGSRKCQFARNFHSLDLTRWTLHCSLNLLRHSGSGIFHLFLQILYFFRHRKPQGNPINYIRISQITNRADVLQVVSCLEAINITQESFQGVSVSDR